MPVKIRLTRMGKKKQPTYRVVVVDSRKPRDGAHIEQIGRYDPRQDPSVVEINNDRAVAWLQQGAQPSDRARKLLEISGAWARFRVARGEIHTIDEAPVPVPPPPKEANVPEAADEPGEEPADEPGDEPGEEPADESQGVSEAVVAESPGSVAESAEPSAGAGVVDEMVDAAATAAESAMPPEVSAADAGDPAPAEEEPS
jgi:small subunit ribosomal protein S16